jgi:lambda repressor-like predicted transcriptional regulator
MITARQKVRIALLERDLTIKKLAKKINYSEVWVHQVLAGKSRSKRVEHAIAAELGMDVTELWSGGRNGVVL